VAMSRNGIVAVKPSSPAFDVGTKPTPTITRRGISPLGAR
jgi:hypothetical protein